MNKAFLLFATAALFTAAKVTAVQPSGKTAATVNGTQIRTDTLTKKLWARYGNLILEEAINEKLLLAEAEKRNIMPSSGEIDAELSNIKSAYPGKQEFQTAIKEQGISEEELRDEINTRLAIRKLAIAWGKLSNTDEEVQQFFEENKGTLGTPKAVKLRQIYAKTRQEAQDMLLALKAGADFAALASQKAQNEQTAKSGGELGYAYINQMIPEVAEAVAKLGKGEYTNVIETPKGCVILKAEDIRPAVEPDFGKLKDSLSSALLQKKIEAILPQILAQLRKDAVIKDNTKR